MRLWTGLHRRDIHPAPRRRAADPRGLGAVGDRRRDRRSGRHVDAAQRLETARDHRPRLCRALSRDAAPHPALHHLLRPRVSAGSPSQPVLAVPARRLRLRRAFARALHRGISVRNLPRGAARRPARAGRGGAGLRHVEPADVPQDHLPDRAAPRAARLLDRDDLDGEGDRARLPHHAVGRVERGAQNPQRHARHLPAADSCGGDLLRHQLRHRRRLPEARAAPLAAPATRGRARGEASHARRDARPRSRRNAQAFRLARSAQGHFADRQRRRRDLDPRLLGLGQEHLPALHQSSGDAGRGRRRPSPAK